RRLSRQYRAERRCRGGRDEADSSSEGSPRKRSDEERTERDTNAPKSSGSAPRAWSSAGSSVSVDRSVWSLSDVRETSESRGSSLDEGAMQRFPVHTGHARSARRADVQLTNPD